MASGSTTSVNVSTPDYTRLKPPLELGSTGLKQLLQCYQVGTDDIRETLMQECDMIIECKVCRSLYRGLANFLAHKRSYCKDRYAGGVLRFQDMTNKEDESFVIGSSIFQDDEEDGDEDDFHFGRKSRRKRPGVDTPDAKIYNYFKNIHKAEQNISKVRSADQIIKLDVIEQNSNAVAQSIGSAAKVLEISKDAAKKRKVPEGHAESPTNPTKFARVNGENRDAADQDKCLDGVIANKVGPLSSLKQIFVSQNLCSSGSNTCNKCHSEFSTYKSLKTHIKRLHMKRRMFNQCRICSKLYIRNDSFVQHLYNDHQFKKEGVMQQILLPKVEKIVIDNSSVFEEFDVKTAPLAKGKSTDSPRSSQKEGSSQNDTDWPNDTMEDDHQSENEDDAGSDDPDALKRGQYLCTKTFWLAVVECLGLYEKGTPRGKTKYICRGHPAMVFNLYTAYKEHILQKHLPKTIRCPLCAESFTKPVHKYFTNFAVHLKTAHNITEMNIKKLSRSLRKSVLDEGMSDSEVDGDDDADATEEAPEEGVDIDPHVSEPQDDPLDRAEEKGLKLYKCVKCNKTSSAFWGLKIHMMQVHDLSSEECMAEKVSIVENAVYQQRRQINRRRTVNLEGGIASTFNLEDFYCPLCFRNYPKVCQVTSHLLTNHGCSKDEADSYKAEIKESRRKHQQENMSGLGRTQRPRQTIPNYAEEEVRSKRKQCSPAKSGSYDLAKTAANEQQEVGSTPDKITFKSGFSLYSCKKCKKVFGQKFALLMHEGSCLKEEDTSVAISDQAEMSCEEGVDTSAHEVQSPQGPSILKSMLKASFPALVCRKCNKNFHKKVARISHESRCMREKAAGVELEASSDEDVQESGVDVVPHSERNTDENKNCDKDGASDNEVLCKVYKCPLCHFEDLELHKISDHLVADHDWSHSKVAARRDTLKRSVVFRQGYKSQSSSEEDTSQKDGGSSDEDVPHNSQGTTSGGGPTSDTISPMTIQDFQCHLCPRVYWDLQRLSNHWGVVHSLDPETITALKKKAQDRKKKQLAEFQVLPRSARRSAAEMIAGSPKKVTAETSPGNDPGKPKQDPL